jgi:hypothetical protein
MHPHSESLVAALIRNALAVQAHPVGTSEGDAAARAYTVEPAAVLGPLMADMPTPLPDEHARQVALLPLPEPLAVGA